MNHISGLGAAAVVAALTLFAPVQLTSQSPEEAVVQVVQDLFDAMRAGDGEALVAMSRAAALAATDKQAEAIDLLLEVEQLPKLVPFCSPQNYEKVALYLRSTAQYAALPEEQEATLITCFEVYASQKRYPEALLLAQKVNQNALIDRVMAECSDLTTRRQMAFMIGRQRNNFESEDEELKNIISYERLSEHFKALARELDVVEPKTPDQIFKLHLEERKGEARIDSSKHNLACTYVNGFVNAGFGKDTLMTPDNSQWIWKNKDTGMQAASASLGLLMLWDIDDGLSYIDKYMDNADDNIVAGSFLAVGLVNSGIKNETDPGKPPPPPPPGRASPRRSVCAP